MGKFSRDKGKRGEQEVVRILKAYGFLTAYRTGEYVKDDIIVSINGAKRVLEVKNLNRGCSSSVLYGALTDAVYAVVHKAARMHWLITLPLDDFCQLAAPARPASIGGMRDTYLVGD